MNQFTCVACVILIVLQQLTLSAFANVKITPIAIDNKSNGKSDLKPEEARYRDPIMPEYYDRNRQGFVTSSYMDNYGGSAYDRYGYNNNLGTTYYDRYGNGNKFSGLDYNREKFGSSFGLNGASPVPSSGLLESKFGLLSGKYPPPPPPTGGAIYGPFNSMGGGIGGFLPPDLEKKTSVILPLAGAALLGIAAYALVSGPGIAAAGPVIGRRRKRSLFDEKVEQHLAYRAHNKKSQKSS